MSYKCEICGKGTTTGNNVSHSHRKTRRKFKPNLQKMRVTSATGTKSIRICTRCLRSNKVTKAV